MKQLLSFLLALLFLATPTFAESPAESYRGFQMDEVLRSEEGDIHYHIHVPESYDASTPFALFVTLPGYEGLYFQGVGTNLHAEEFGFEAQKYAPNMIVAAPQLDDWGMTSARQTVALTEHLTEAYNIDPSRVYIEGYSGGGETLSLALELRPELFAGALHVSSQWDGDLAPVAQSRTPLYFAIGEDDEYYGSAPAKEAYAELRSLYVQQGLTEAEIADLLILDVKPASYFAERGMTNQHGGGGLFAQDEEIMGWLFRQRRSDIEE